MSTPPDRIRIVHVDDDPDYVDLTKSFLERDDRFTVATATSAEEGLELLADSEFDCVVSDYDMPGTNGLELLDAVRDSTPDLPFILFTGKGSEEVASDAISAGATDYLQKGSGTDQYELLANRIENAVSQVRGQRAERHLRELAETTNHVLCVFTDDRSEVLFVNSAYEDIWGRSIETLHDDPSDLLEGVHPDDRERVREVMKEVSNGETVEHEFRINSDEDYQRWVRMRGEPIRDDTGNVVRVAGFATEITEQKHRQLEVEQYQQLVDSLPDPVVIYDREGRYELVNQATTELQEVSADELEGTHSPHIQRIQERRDDDPFEALVTGDRDEIRGEYSAEFSEGDELVFEYRFTPFVVDGEREGIVAISRDITDRKGHERQLERIREFFTEAERLGKLGAWEFDASGDVVWTDGTRRIHEVDDDYDPSLEEGIEFFHPDDRDTIRAAARRALEAGEPYDIEARLITAEDSERWIRTRGGPLPDDESTIRGFIQDITERKERERELEHHREYTADLLDAIDDLFFVHDEAGSLQQWNRSFNEVTGYTDEEIGRIHGTDFVPEEHRETAAAAIGRVFETGRGRAEAPLLTKDGERIPYEYVANRVIHPDGDPRLVGIGRDITERKERERDLERSRDLLRHTEQVASVGGVEIDPRNETVRWTDGTRAIHGVADDYEPSVETALDFYPDDRDAVQRQFERCVETGEPYHGEYRIRTVTDEVRWVEIRGEPVQEDGDTVLVRGAIQDITAHKEREQELERQNERLEEFAGVVSHDLRSPLGVIGGRLELAREDCDSEHLDAMASAHDRMNRLIEDLLTLAREGTQASDTEPVDLGTLAETSWRTVTLRDAEMRVETDRTIRAESSRLRQVLENLFRNALEHGGSDATVTVGPLDDGFYVADDGPGIPEAERRDVFEAGYSTAEDGTGFGLSIVKEVAEAHRWDITVTEGIDGGARFEITGVEFVE